MNREILARLHALRQANEPAALVTRLNDGEQALITIGESTGALALDEDARELVLQKIQTDASGMLEEPHATLFVRVYNPPLRLVLVGAVHITQALIPIAAIAGYAVTVIDPRAAFANEQRFPTATVTTDWPDEAMRRLAPDKRTAVVTLTHDPKLDDPALKEALKTEAFYIGSLGSRKTHAARLQRLRADGVAEVPLQRIHAPVGLSLGSRRPPDIAVSVMAQIIQVANKASR